jgi:hypothetical protein
MHAWMQICVPRRGNCRSIGKFKFWRRTQFASMQVDEKRFIDESSFVFSTPTSSWPPTFPDLGTREGATLPPPQAGNAGEMR